MSNIFSEARRIVRETRNYDALTALMPYSHFIGVKLLEIDG